MKVDINYMFPFDGNNEMPSTMLLLVKEDPAQSFSSSLQKDKQQDYKIYVPGSITGNPYNGCIINHKPLRNWVDEFIPYDMEIMEISQGSDLPPSQ